MSLVEVSLKWLFPADEVIPLSFSEAIGGDPLVARLLYQRGFRRVDEALAFLDPTLYTPSEPDDLPDLGIAVERIINAARGQESILVWGDFDVDGQTATSLLVDGLTRLGALVSFHIPHRMEEGHGISPATLKRTLENKQRPDLIISCDTGITAYEAAEVAQVAGIDLIITDHHDLGPTLPPALAVISNQRLPQDHPARSLPGVGVAFLLMKALFRHEGREEETEDFLDLLALGIVADVVEQVKDARYWLQRGMESLKTTRRIGLQALMRSAQVIPDSLSSETIGFQIAPRLNALGRLGSADMAVTLLTTQEPLIADQVASHLEMLNERRKSLENQVYGAAQQQIINDPTLLEFEAILLAGPDWHLGVNGIVASRLVEQYQKPAIVMQAASDGIARGSARSTPDVNINEALTRCSDNLISWGGHPGAAGMSLKTDLIPKFRYQLSNTIRDIRDTGYEAGITVDAALTREAITFPLLEEINRLSPFGEGNPPFTIAMMDQTLVAHASFGSNSEHRRLEVVDTSGTKATIIWWKGGDRPLPPERLDLVIIPRVNEYRGRRSIQLEFVDSRRSASADMVEGKSLVLHDLRTDIAALSSLPTNIAVWAENPEIPPCEALQARMFTRADLPATNSLILWTIPPGSAVLSELIQASGAREFYIFGKETSSSARQSFISRLGSLVKYSLTHEAGVIDPHRLAGAIGQKETTVMAGIAYLEAIGVIMRMAADGMIVLKQGGKRDPIAAQSLLAELDVLLLEAAAYRRHFARADLQPLFEKIVR